MQICSLLITRLFNAFQRLSNTISSAALLGLLCYSATVVAEPVLTAGSIYQINEVATVQGTGFGANETVQIRLIDPSGNSLDQSATADEKGNLSVSLVLADEGKYFAVLMDSNDDPVISVSMTAM